jgi:hypothetical protein
MQECMKHCVTFRQSLLIPERSQVTSSSVEAYSVRWMETATLKHASDKASGPFARQLCFIYTRGLVVVDEQLICSTVFPERIDAVSLVSNIAACFEATRSVCNPVFSSAVVDKVIRDAALSSVSDEMMF